MAEPWAEVPPDLRATLVIELAVREARRRGHRRLHPIDLLAGLLLAGDPEVVEALRGMGADVERIVGLLRPDDLREPEGPPEPPELR